MDTFVQTPVNSPQQTFPHSNHSTRASYSDSQSKYIRAIFTPRPPFLHQIQILANKTFQLSKNKGQQQQNLPQKIQTKIHEKGGKTKSLKGWSGIWFKLRYTTKQINILYKNGHCHKEHINSRYKLQEATVTIPKSSFVFQILNKTVILWSWSTRQIQHHPNSSSLRYSVVGHYSRTIYFFWGWIIIVVISSKSNKSVSTIWVGVTILRSDGTGSVSSHHIRIPIRLPHSLNWPVGVQSRVLMHLEWLIVSLLLLSLCLWPGLVVNWLVSTKTTTNSNESAKNRPTPSISHQDTLNKKMKKVLVLGNLNAQTNYTLCGKEPTMFGLGIMHFFQ